MITRSFIPVNIFECNSTNLLSLGLTNELAKRILEKKVLWITRMSNNEIVRLHEADLLTRYNVTTNSLDIIEIAAVYYSLPLEFPKEFDKNCKKQNWRDNIEEVLRKMLIGFKNEQLPKYQKRAQVYSTYSEVYGPIKDLHIVKDFRSNSSDVDNINGESRPRRRSFTEVCEKHSIIGKLRQIK